MLVLSRRAGEEVVLPGVLVKVVILGVSGGRVRVGVVAPADVVVLRGELPHTQDEQPKKIGDPAVRGRKSS